MRVEQAYRRPVCPSIVLALALVGSACSSAPKTPEFSGFLDSYEGFEPHPTRKGALLWVKPGPDPVLGYKEVLLDHVAVWYKAREEGVDPDELQGLADDFKLAIHRALGDAYPMTQTPGPGVLRLRIAITDVGKASALHKTLRVLSGPGAGTSGYDGHHESKNLEIESLSIEAEVLDSVTGERLVALIEHKNATTKSSSTRTWGSVRGALAQWAGYLRLALDEASDGV